MQKDRQKIYEIISEMLDNRDQHGIYPTTNAFDELEKYIECARCESIGWTHADACIDLDKGEDPRQKIVPNCA